MSLLDFLRIFFGCLFVLFVPGFAWSFVILRKRERDLIERIAISAGLSLALVPLTLFWLHYLFGVGLTLLNAVLAVCGLAAVPAAYLLSQRLSLGRRALARLRLWYASIKGKGD